MTAPRLLLLAIFALCACSPDGSGIDLHDNPGPGVQKDNGPLTVPPANLVRQPGL